MIAAELRYTPRAWRSNTGTMSTTSSSLASFCMTSVVGPGMGSAMSKRSHCCDLQKYGALNSSLRQMICAPRAAASRTCATAWSSVACASWEALSWMIPTVNGRVVMKGSRLQGLRAKVAQGTGALLDYCKYQIHDI